MKRSRTCADIQSIATMKRTRSTPDLPAAMDAVRISPRSLRRGSIIGGGGAYSSPERWRNRQPNSAHELAEMIEDMRLTGISSPTPRCHSGRSSLNAPIFELPQEEADAEEDRVVEGSFPLEHQGDNVGLWIEEPGSEDRCISPGGRPQAWASYHRDFRFRLSFLNQKSVERSQTEMGGSGSCQRRIACPTA
jgi:hypothetical protein